MAYACCSLLFGTQGSGRRDSRDVIGEWERSWLPAVIEGHCYFARSRCHAVLLSLNNP